MTTFIVAWLVLSLPAAAVIGRGIALGNQHTTPWIEHRQ